jgi:hypothetical protein
MEYIMEFSEYLKRPKRYTKTLDELSKYRKYNGDRYRIELLPKFVHLNGRWNHLKLPDWFEAVQQADDQFYSFVHSGEISQPDVRELWRDLTGRPESKYGHVLNPKIHV